MYTFIYFGLLIFLNRKAYTILSEIQFELKLFVFKGHLIVVHGIPGAESLQTIKPGNDFTAVSDIPLPRATAARVLDARTQPDVNGKTARRRSSQGEKTPISLKSNLHTVQSNTAITHNLRVHIIFYTLNMF